ncbi:MAG: zinc ABC transporter substrate-binding protein [Bacteroidales bacterium]|nr:zinc ABC transporter substrate-binding protein [Bacteroidales bacterium]
MKHKHLILKSIHGFFAFTAIGILAVFMPGCRSHSPVPDKKMITVSILPQKYFAERITGDDFQINVLIPPGAGPETYDPTPRQIEELHRSAAYLKSGYLELETGWLEKIASGIPSLKLIDTSEGVPLITEGGSNDHHHGIEPHIWMSARNAVIICNNMYNFFVSEFPEQREKYHSNFETLTEEINALDSRTGKRLSEHGRKKFLIYHPALTYYARDYGLEQLSLEHHGKEPSAAHLARIIDMVRQEKIGSLMVQKQFDKSKAGIVANETGISIVQVDPLDYEWMKQYELITDIICGK